MLGGQFDWGGRLLKSSGGVQRLARPGRKPGERVDVYKRQALYTAFKVGESRLPHVLKELGLQQAVGAHQPRGPIKKHHEETPPKVVSPFMMLARQSEFNIP